VINAFLPANLPLIRVLLPGRCCGGATLPRGSGGRKAGNNGSAAIQDVGDDPDDAGAMQDASLDLAQGLEALIVEAGLSPPAGRHKAGPYNFGPATGAADNDGKERPNKIGT
jgi:hypothetical protein